MTSITQMPDTPCCYPTEIGVNQTLAVGTTPKLLAAFRNNSSIPSLRGVLQRISLKPHDSTADTLVTIHFVAMPTLTGGTWEAITGSEFEINKTATFSGGKVAYTSFSYAHQQHGNTPAGASSSDIIAMGMGLEMYVGQTFAIVAFTETAASATDIAWTLNWLERD